MAYDFYDKVMIVASIVVFALFVFSLLTTKIIDSYSCGPVQLNVSDCNCSNAIEKSEVEYLYCEKVFISPTGEELVCKVNISNRVFE